jgi:hypothetical protein
VAGLAEILGFEPVAMLWISMAYAYGQAPDIAFRLLRK